MSANANSSDERSPLELPREISDVTFTRIYVGGRRELQNIYFTEFENEDFYRNNVFTITCKILVRASREFEPQDYSIDSGLKYTCSYKKDCVIRTMKSMRNRDFSDFSDIQLVTPTKTFPAHKIVLAATSPVFAAMFRSSMLESKDNSVDIRDFDEAAVEGMLEHMYTGQVSNFEDKAVQLLRISDKYELLELKGECEELLRFNLKMESAVEVLQMSTLVNAVTLKASAEKFIKRNFNKMKETESIKNLIKTNPEVLVDLLSVV